MKLNFPLKTQDLKRWRSATQQFEACNSPVGGWFPVGRNGFYHNGVHIDGDHPVHAVGKGDLIAYRLSEDYVDRDALQTYPVADKQLCIVRQPISDNFVLTRHVLTPKDCDPIVFYVLYMHLMPCGPVREKTANEHKAVPVFFQSRFFVKRNGVKPNQGLTVYNNSLSPMEEPIPPAAELFFDDPHKVAANHRLHPFDLSSRFKRITGYEREGQFHPLPGYVIPETTTVEVRKRIDYQLDRVVVRDYPLRQGDVLGFSGRDGAVKDDTTVHMELFIKDETSYTALQTYTDRQQAALELPDDALLNLKGLITGKTITDAICHGNTLRDLFPNLSKILEVGYPGTRLRKMRMSRLMLNPDKHPATLDKLRRLVVKTKSEWHTVKGEYDCLKLNKGGTYSDEKYSAYLELFQEKMDFWHLLKDDNGKAFPDECYFFHPIKFIEHLKILEQVNRGLDIWYFKDKDMAAIQNPVTFEMDRKEVTCEPGNMLFKSKFAFGKYDNVCLKQGKKRLKLIPKLAKFRPNANGDIDIIYLENFKEDEGALQPYLRSKPTFDANTDVDTSQSYSFFCEDTEESEFDFGDNGAIFMEMNSAPVISNVTFESSEDMKNSLTKEGRVLDVDELSDQDQKWFVAAILEKMDERDHASIVKELLFSGGSALRHQFVKSFANKVFLQQVAVAGPAITKADKALAKFPYKAILKVPKVHPQYGFQIKNLKMNPLQRFLAKCKVAGELKYVESMFGSSKKIVAELKATTKGNVIAFAIVGAIDICQWYKTPAEQRKLSDILVQLGFDFSFVMASGYASTLLAESIIFILSGLGYNVGKKGKIALGFFIFAGVSVYMICADWDQNLIEETKQKVRARIDEIEKENTKTDIIGREYYEDPISGIRVYKVENPI